MIHTGEKLKQELSLIYKEICDSWSECHIFRYHALLVRDHYCVREQQKADNRVETAFRGKVKGSVPIRVRDV